MIIAREFRFEAAHFLPDHPKCGKVHGHSYRLVVAIEGPVRKDGMVLDFSELKDHVEKTVLDKVDHRLLNDIPRLRQPPTVENLLLTFAVVSALVLIMVGMIRARTIVPEALPQGRYLFPVIIPLAFLLVLGWREIIPQRLRLLALLVLLNSFFFFDLVCLVYYLIPHYYG